MMVGLAVSSLLLIAFAPGASSDSSLAAAASDPALQWGACPDFMPKGCGIAVLHGDPSKANADVFFKIPAKKHAPQHWHTSAERMVLVAGELKVTYDGQPTKTLKPGMYAYGPPKHAHAAHCVSDVDCVLFIAFESPVDAIAGTSDKT
jgi:quercetin dioxygenase-like cupin family protein